MSVLATGATAESRAQSIGLDFTGVTESQGAQLNSNAGYAPPDGSGAVGQSSIVQLINGAFAVYDKSTGSQEQLISGRQFWLNAGVDPGTAIANLGAFNQRILYDPLSDRWIAAALSGESVDNRVLLARSDTNDPGGTWQGVSFLGNAGGSGRFVDYTRLGVDANGVYLSTNNYFSLELGGIDSVSVFSLPKSDLLAPAPTLANLSRFDALDHGAVGWTIQPVINFGTAGSTASMLGTTAANVEGALYRTDLSGTAGLGATMTPEATLIEVDPYDLPPRAAQPGDAVRTIGTIDHRFKSNVYEVDGVLYAAHDVKVGDNVGIAWVKIDAATNAVIQEGILSDPNFDYFEASIAANANGDVVIGFNRSGFGPDGHLTIMAALGTTLGDVTTFADPLLIHASTVNYLQANGRWGDWSTTLVDPFHPNVFWTFQEYALGNNEWATRITQIIVPEPDGWLLAGSGVVLLTIYLVRRRTHGPTRRTPRRLAA